MDEAITFGASQVRRVSRTGSRPRTIINATVLVLSLTLTFSLSSLALLLAVIQLLQVELQVPHRIKGVKGQGREFSPQTVLLLPLLLQGFQGLIQLPLCYLPQPRCLVQLSSQLLLLIVLLGQLQLYRFKLNLKCDKEAQPEGWF